MLLQEVCRFEMMASALPLPFLPLHLLPILYLLFPGVISKQPVTIALHSIV